MEDHLYQYCMEYHIYFLLASFTMLNGNIFFILYTLSAVQALVVQRVDNAIHRINHYPVDSLVCFLNTYPVDSNLSGG